MSHAQHPCALDLTFKRHKHDVRRAEIFRIHIYRPKQKIPSQGRGQGPEPNAPRPWAQGPMPKAQDPTAQLQKTMRTLTVSPCLMSTPGVVAVVVVVVVVVLVVVVDVGAGRICSTVEERLNSKKYMYIL